jgi:hypothetical protein
MPKRTHNEAPAIAVVVQSFDFVNHDPILQVYIPTAKQGGGMIWPKAKGIYIDGDWSSARFVDSR